MGSSFASRCASLRALLATRLDSRCTKRQQGSRFGGARGPPPVFVAERRDLSHEGGIRRRERMPIHPHVVLEPGPAMTAELERPARERHLVLADAGARPG